MTKIQHNDAMNSYIRLVALLSRLCGITAAGMVLVSVLIVCQMVFLRYVLQESVIWQTEFVTYMLITATLVGSPYVLLLRGHVNVDLLPQYLGQRGRFILAIIASVLALMFCLVAAWTGFEFWYEAWESDWHSDTVWSPRLWIPYLSMPLGFGILSLQYIADILSLVSGRDMPFGLSQGAGE